jgi:uncharacterized membrane protein YkvA (DUF1232 family)
MTFEAPDYLAALESCVAGYAGAYARTVLRAPQVFGFYSALYGDERLSDEARDLVKAVLAYFVVPRDVMPEEELGPYGLLDDLFLAAHVYRLLGRLGLPAEVLAGAWPGDEDLEAAMDEIYSDARAAVGQKRREVLRMAGLGHHD